jgi:regulatory protein YycI of two-component signal transduction system YycFG
MSSEALLYPAIFIFTLLVIGLVLTVREFTKMGAESDEKLRQKEGNEAKEQ